MVTGLWLESVRLPVQCHPEALELVARDRLGRHVEQLRDRPVGAGVGAGLVDPQPGDDDGLFGVGEVEQLLQVVGQRGAVLVYQLDVTCG